MNNFNGIRLLMTLSLILAQLSSAQAQKPGYKGLVLPDHAHFPVSQDRLLVIRDSQDVDKMREHAWSIFAGLTNSSVRSTVPIWESWYTKCDVKIATPAYCPSPADHSKDFLRNLEIPVQSLHQFLDLKGMLESLQSDQKTERFLDDWETPPQFAGVLYNYEAAQHILKKHLYSVPRLDGLRNAIANANAKKYVPPTRIPNFPRASIVVKTEWQVVYDLGHGQTTPLFIWDPDVAKRRRSAGNYDSMNVQDWGKTVVIDTSGRACDDRDYQDGEAVPLDCFYSRSLPGPDLDATSGEVQGIIERDKPANAGTPYLILMGVHLTTKEIPDWVWATFWWYNRVSESPYSADRPARLVGKWRHFLMDTTFSDTTPLDPVDGKNKICYNPYLEERFSGGIVSNCIQCHKRAVYGAKEDGYKFAEEARGVDPKTISKDDPYFNGVVRVDFLWSVSAPQDLNPFMLTLRQFLVK